MHYLLLTYLLLLIAYTTLVCRDATLCLSRPQVPVLLESCYRESKCTTNYLLTITYTTLVCRDATLCHVQVRSSLQRVEVHYLLLTYFLLLIAYSTLVCRDATLCHVQVRSLLHRVEVHYLLLTHLLLLIQHWCVGMLRSVCLVHYLLTYLLPITYSLYNIGVSGCYALSHRCLPCLNLKWHH